MEYEFQSFGSSGAYDVWRYMWYTVVVIKDSTIQSGQNVQVGNIVIGMLERINVETMEGMKTLLSREC